MWHAAVPAAPLPSMPSMPSMPSPHPCAGILFALLHAPEALAALPGAQADGEGALRYVLGLECDAEGKPGVFVRS